MIELRNGTGPALLVVGKKMGKNLSNPQTMNDLMEYFSQS